jgi:DNA adenine methylase
MKPLIKWIGGKTNILNKIFEKFPKSFNNYHEIFIGGGSILIELLYRKKKKQLIIHGNIYAYDINETLIHFYKNIQNNPHLFYDTIKIYIEQYNSCNNIENINRNPQNIEEALENKENYYYYLRKKYNELYDSDKKTMNGSVLFLMLNKLCFRGMYRIGPNGFNVPYGNYKNPEIINKQQLLEFSQLIKDVIFEVCDFSTSLNNFDRLKENDFVYCDPPYFPEKSTSFVKYVENGFNEIQHISLFNLLKNLNQKNIKFIMSNSNTQLVKDNFNINNHYIYNVLARRAINSKDPSSKVNELIITNFQ